MRPVLPSMLGGILLAAIAPAAAQSQDRGNLNFLSWGGTVQTMLEKEGWAERFHEATGCTVTLVPKATSAEIIATAIAQKDNPQVDVVMADQAAFQQGIAQGIFAELGEDAVPNLARMATAARIGTTGVSPYADVLAIVYNHDVFARNGWAPPTGWMDLFRPEFQGKVIVPPATNTYGMYYLVEMARQHGGSVENMDPGFEAMKRLAAGVVDWTTTFAKIADLMQQETAVIAVFGNASGWEIARRGVPVTVIVPGNSYLSPTVAGLMDGAPNPECAQTFLDWLIGVEVLTYRAERFGQTPMNVDVVLQGDAAQRVLTGDRLAGLQVVDYDYVSSVRDSWNERFTREVLPIQ